jgi:hypothetical protein
MCDKPAVTREHAPPLAFFPSNLRTNLITVPSCKFHNNDNSADVEYVRNIIVTDINSNEVARLMFKEKVLPSYRRSPKLKSKTFARVREVKLGEMDTAIVQANRIRFNRIMRGIASALYFHEFGEAFPYRWNVHPATMLSENQAFLDLPDEVTPRMNELLRSVPVADRDTNQPQVFKYGLYRRDEYAAVYRLVFYGAVDTYVYGLPPEVEERD